MLSQRRTILAALCSGLIAIGLSVTVFAVRGLASAGRPSAQTTTAAPSRPDPTLPAVSLPPGADPTTGSTRPPAPGSGHASTSAPASPSTSTSGSRPTARRTVGPLGTQILTGSSAVALTFDDGPDPALTPKVLDVLKQHGVKATFCVIGSRARDYPDLIKRIAAEGHTLCNHSWQHLLDLGKRDYSYQSWDLSGTNDAIHAAVPDAQIRYFRAPGGNFTPQMVDLAQKLGMVSLNWDVDPRDWDAKSFGTGEAMVRHIVSVVQRSSRPGSIVLSHDRGHPDTPTAYQTLLPWLLERYRLIPLP
jgi:peptidoglycan/xylan/chitin deacetylase (PgdA/CDA1 family)